MSAITIFLISVFLVATSLSAFTQSIVVSNNPEVLLLNNDTTNNQNSTLNSTGSSSKYKKQQDSKSQIFVGKDWPQGTIVFRDGRVMDKYYLRYDFLKDQMQFVIGKDTLIFANPYDLNTISFDGHTFIYENYQYEDSICQGYFELIVPGKNKLLLKKLVTNQKPDSKYPDDESLIKYKVSECYFISKPGMPAYKLACNRKSALTFLNGHNEDIEEYLRITGNKVRTIEDLKLLVSYYNSLDEDY